LRRLRFFSPVALAPGVVGLAKSGFRIAAYIFEIAVGVIRPKGAL